MRAHYICGASLLCFAPSNREMGGCGGVGGGGRGYVAALTGTALPVSALTSTLCHFRPTQ